MHIFQGSKEIRYLTFLLDIKKFIELHRSPMKGNLAKRPSLPTRTLLCSAPEIDTNGERFNNLCSCPLKLSVARLLLESILRLYESCDNRSQH